jgi:hypothetical protein
MRRLLALAGVALLISCAGPRASPQQSTVRPDDTAVIKQHRLGIPGREDRISERLDPLLMLSKATKALEDGSTLGRVSEVADTLADVKRWRERAGEIRTLAESFSHSASKRTLQQVADSYDMKMECRLRSGVGETTTGR